MVGIFGRIKKNFIDEPLSFNRDRGFLLRTQFRGCVTLKNRCILNTLKGTFSPRPV